MDFQERVPNSLAESIQSTKSSSAQQVCGWGSRQWRLWGGQIELGPKVGGRFGHLSSHCPSSLSWTAGLRAVGGGRGASEQAGSRGCHAGEEGRPPAQEKEVASEGLAQGGVGRVKGGAICRGWGGRGGGYMGEVVCARREEKSTCVVALSPNPFLSASWILVPSGPHHRDTLCSRMGSFIMQPRGKT